MNYKIIEVFLDPADKYRARVQINDIETQFFKFDHYPTQDEVNILVDDYLINQANTTIINNE